VKNSFCDLTKEYHRQITREREYAVLYIRSLMTAVLALLALFM